MFNDIDIKNVVVSKFSDNYVYSRLLSNMRQWLNQRRGGEHLLKIVL